MSRPEKQFLKKSSFSFLAIFFALIFALTLPGCGGGGGGPRVSQPPMVMPTPDSMPGGGGVQIPEAVTSLREAARAIPRLGRRSVTQSGNTDGNNVTTDTAEAVFDYGQMTMSVTRSDGTRLTLDSMADASSTALGTPVRNGQISRKWQLEKQFSGNTATVRSFGEIPASEFPLRAVRASGNYATNDTVIKQWEASGRSNPLVPQSYIDWLKKLHVNLVGFSVSLHYEDSMDSTVERLYTGDTVLTYSDDAIRQFIREFKQHGIDTYLTLSFESEDAENSSRPVLRWQLGDSGEPQTGVPPDDPDVFVRILPENWPWNPNHPDHKRFVAEFWKTLTDQAVHFARIAEEEGVPIFSLGTETDRLFLRTRTGDSWPNDFRQELQNMVRRVREVYSGLLTYDMHYSALTFDEPGAGYVWEDLGLDIVGVSAYFEMADSPPTSVISVEDFEKRYEEVFQKYLKPLAERNPGRPIVFLEYGTIDTLEGPASPGATDFRAFVFEDRDGNGLDDGRENQANMYQALINTMARYPGLVNGILWTESWVASDELWAEYWAGRRHWNVRDKLSEDVVRLAHESWADWLTGGYWMLVDGNSEVTDVGAFVDGPELAGAPTLPSLGTATYQGFATGGYAAVYGSDYPNVTAGSHEVGEYEGQLELTADFGTRRISGRVHSISLSGIHTPTGGSSRPITDVAAPYVFSLGETSFDTSGFTGNTTVSSTNPGISVENSAGSWGGKFSVVSDGDGNPRLVAGTHGEEFTTAGGTEAGFIGAFAGVTGR